MRNLRRCKSAEVAQLVEQPIRNRQVTSSTLVVGSILFTNGTVSPPTADSYDLNGKEARAQEMDPRPKPVKLALTVPYSPVP